MASGHRMRLRKRFENENIDTIPEYVVLEMMLTGVVLRRDTCELARRLIETFGSLAKVIDAPESELLKVEGMGPSAAAQLKLLPLFYRKYRLSQWGNQVSFSGLEEIGNYLSDKLIGYRNEVVLLLCMDSSCRMLACRKVFEGSISAVSISIRSVVDTALSCRAARVVLAHNHLSGNALPSNEDLAATRKIREALALVSVRLDDHVIVAEGDYVSLAQSGFFNSQRA